MADVKWIKLSTDIFSNRKIVQIESMPEGDALIVIWLKLLILAGETNADGMVWFTSSIPYTEQMLATAFGRPMSTIQLALKTFSAFGMIEIVDDFIKIPNWDKYQNVDRLKEIREYNRLAQQKSRERKRLAASSGNTENNDSKQCQTNVNDKSMTSQRCHETDIDIDKELDNKSIKEEKVKKEESPASRDGVMRIFDKFAGDDDELALALQGFAQMRKANKKPLTENAAALICKKLSKFPQWEWVEIVNQSTMNGWQGIFPLDNGRSGAKARGGAEATIDRLKRMTEEGAFDE